MKNRPTPLNINSAILSTTFQLFPLDYFGKRYCVFQEDAIMMQNTARRLTSVAVMATTFCVIIGVFCNLPQVTSLGSECYTITGVDYRGNQNKIDLPPDLTGAADLVQSTTCLPWNTSIESRKPRARERGIGPHDHCRNPDGDIIPWCKVPELPGTVGAWGYCHLPKCKVPGYIGCFLDKGEPEALDAVSILHKSMTVGSCLSFCRRKGYRYAGLEAGHACYCGNHGYDRYSSSAERGTHCATKCFGNKGQPCGGDGYVDVYHTYIGSCGQTLHDQHGAVYSPGYPDFPSSQGLVTSLTASDAMMIKLKEKSYRGLDLTADDNDEPGPAMKDAENPKKTCEWIIDVKHATAIKMLVRKIDAKQKLGGVIEIEAVDDAMIDITIPTRTFDMTSSNMTSPNVTQPNAFSGKSKVVWICDSLKARGEIDVIVPDNEINDRRSKRSEDQAENNLPKDSKPHWFEHLLKRKQGRYVIPYNSLEPLFTINSGRVIVRYIRSSDLLTSLKSTFDSKVHRSRNRKKTSSEWSRFVIEYEATLPVGMTINDISDDITKKDDVSQSKHNKNKHLKLHKPATEDRQSTDIRSRGKTSFTAQVSQDSIGKTRFTISQADAEAIKEAMTSKSERSESAGSESANSPIKIEVFVEPVAGDGSSTNGKNGNSKVMSEFTIPLLLAVLLTTTAILILSAVLLIFRRGGISLIKKQDKRHLPDYSSHGGLVVACQTPPHGRKDFGKSSSDSNLSSSSTADSLLLTESEGSKYSPNFTRDPTALKNLMEILKGHPGILQNRSQLDAEQYKQITQQAALLNFSSESALRPENRSDDVTPLPGPCPYCCGCPEENRVHRHGDSCRTHHKQSKTSSSIARGNKNPRNLTIRGCLKSSAGPQQGTAVAPPLSPISEVSSIASSMTSLPITSSNSQISLLARHTPTSQSGKHSHVWKNSKPAVDNPNLLNALETEAFLSPESDAESGVGDLRPPINESSIPLMNKSTKLRFSENISEKIVPGRYLGNGGGSGGCYDSGYATSNYEEEEEDKRNKSEIKKENKIFASSEGESEIPLENLLVS